MPLGPAVDAEVGRHVVGRTELTIGAGPHQADSRGCEPSHVHRLVEAQIDGANEEDAGVVGQAHTAQHRCKGVGHDFERDQLRKPDIAAGVGGTHLHGDGVGARANGGCLGQQLEREADIRGHDLAVDKQFHRAHLLIVGDRGQHPDRAALQHLDASGVGVGVDRIDRDGHARGLALVVEAQVVDDLQATGAIGHEGQAVGQLHVHRRGRQIDAGEEGVGVAGVGGAGHVQRIDVLAALAAHMAGGDEQA